MKKILFGLATIATVGLSALNAASAPAPYALHAYELKSKTGGYEFIGNINVTANDHGGPSQSSVVMYGYPHYGAPEAHIGSSYGHLNKEISLFNSSNIKVGTMFVYDYYNVTQGTFRARYGSSLSDRTPVYVK